MPITRSPTLYKLRNIFLLITRYRSHVDTPIPHHLPEVPMPKYKYGFQVNQGLHLLHVDSEVQSEVVTNMGKVVDVQQRMPSHPKPAYPSWARWILGAILSLFLPFWKKNWDSFLTIEDEVEMFAEGVEKVATVTEKLSAEVADKLSDNGKLKKAALLIERTSKEAVKDAKLTEDFIHKAEELEQEVETIIEPVTDMRSFKNKEICGH